MSKTTRWSRPGELLRTLRHFHRLNQRKLAELSGIGQSTISEIEKNKRALRADLAPALADVLKVDPAFFFSEAEPARPETCQFRGLKSTPLWARLQGAASVALLQQLLEAIEEYVNFPLVNLPDTRGSSPAEAARIARRHWGLGDDLPISSVIRVLENAGVIVAKFSCLSDKVDAYSQGTGRRPVAVLSAVRATESATRRRMSNSHELGHLLYRHVGCSKENEDCADEFAAEFLIPEPAFVHWFPRSRSHIPWRELWEMKSEWGVSVTALLFRANRLGLIRPSLYKRAMRHLGRGRSERHEPPCEEPEALAAALTLVNERRVPYRTLAEQLDWTAELFERVTGIEVPPPEADLNHPNVIPFPRSS